MASLPSAIEYENRSRRRIHHEALAAPTLANEQRMGELAVIGLVRALAEKYPCK